MSKARPILTFVLIILIGIITILALGWIAGFFTADMFQQQTVKWFLAAVVVSVAGLAIALLDDSMGEKKKR